MGKLLYKLFTFLYPLAARIISPFNEKARLWHQGRKNLFQQLTIAFAKNTSPVIWVHCASLGEFEQGRPVIERLTALYPNHKILLTFFSPSGYEVQNNYAHADFIYYLPIDSYVKAKLFLQITKPSLILFIKYEFWFYYLSEAKKQQIPLLLVSAIFRKDQPFFKWYGAFHRKMLACFTHIFTQDKGSTNLLEHIGLYNHSVSGDTRFDRVLAIATNFEPISEIETFCKDHKVVVAGSTWLEDEEELNHYANTHPAIRFIIAPHNIDKDRLAECSQLFKHSILYSEFSALMKNNSSIPISINTIIIDNIGMLSRLYKYATITFVGGAFGGDGVHNVLEAAVYGKPVVFGPVFDKYLEAIELLELGGAFSVEDALELDKLFDKLLNTHEFYTIVAESAQQYVQKKAGATDSIIKFIQEKRLLIK